MTPEEFKERWDRLMERQKYEGKTYPVKIKKSIHSLIKMQCVPYEMSVSDWVEMVVLEALKQNK